MADFATLFADGIPNGKIAHVFDRQALPMVWDYVEVNPFSELGQLG
jgi:putative DNA methylase